jgi:CheY-like chemotaxis protein
VKLLTYSLVRTPLNSIINYLEIALEEPLDERSRNHLHKSLQASKALVFVVNDLLSLTEVEGIDFKNHEDNIDLRQVITDLTGAFKDKASNRVLEINLTDDEAIPTVVRCDPAGLRQVLSNLLTNSIEHGTGDVVNIELTHLSATEENDLVEIAFQDKGKGLTEAELDSIFLDLEQVLDEDEDGREVPDVESTRHKFIGLGLAFTARFVRLNYGQITMSSKPGKGTRVSVKIPFRKAIPVKTPVESPKGLSLPTPPVESAQLTDPLTVILDNAGKVKVTENLTIQIANPKMVTSPSTIYTPSSLSSATTTPNSRYPFPEMNGPQLKFNVLIAEDNPLNSRLLEARLMKRGHKVKVTVDGQACADTFMRTPDAFDVILMDLQVSIMFLVYFQPVHEKTNVFSDATSRWQCIHPFNPRFRKNPLPFIFIIESEIYFILLFRIRTPKESTDPDYCSICFAVRKRT